MVEILEWLLFWWVIVVIINFRGFLLWLVSFRGAEIQVHTYSFLFWVVLGYVGLGSDDGCFLAFLVWYESLGLDNGGGGSFLLVGSLSLGWLGLD